MSLLTIGAVGVYRDLAPQAKRISAQTTVAADPAAPAHPAAATGGAAPASPGTAQDAGSVASFAQLLVAQIPSEALLAYTTLLAVFSAATTGYQSGRWTLYGLSLVACAASVIGTYLTKRNYTFADIPADKSRQLRHQLRHLPLLPTVTAIAAMAVYGLTIPGSALQHATSGTGFAIIAGCLAVGGGFMMSLFVPFLANGNGANARPHTDNGPAKQIPASQ
jgi:hypothetical protein